MTSIDNDSFAYESLGRQAQSQRRSPPNYGISKVGRDAREKVFISGEHSRATALCRQSPIGGAIYDLPSTLDLKSGVAFTKGSLTQGGMPGFNQKVDENLDCNNELQILVDSQQFKYGRDATILIGTEPRGRLKDAELIKNHAAAFFGRASPGPAAVGGAGGPDDKISRKRIGYAMPFGVKVSKPDWQKINFSGDNVGPGMYPRKDIAVGKQHLSQRRNQPLNEFTKASTGRLPLEPKAEDKNEAKKERFAKDVISNLDAAKTSCGKQVLSRNRSEPTVGFGRGTRDRRSRTAMCMTREDMGPSAYMPKPFHSMPQLPMESRVMRAGWD